MSIDRNYENIPSRSRNSRMLKDRDKKSLFGRNKKRAKDDQKKIRSKKKKNEIKKEADLVSMSKNVLSSKVNQVKDGKAENDRIVKIKAEHVSKRFEMLKTRNDKLKSLFNFRKRDQNYFWSLRDVSFEVLEGQTVAIVGLNGSGKSTLLKAVSEFIPITAGSLNVNGSVSEISVNAGLKTNLTGRDNIYLRMYMAGFSKKQVKALLPEIIDFSELGEFIDQPVKSYSSGMRSKLGFSIMIQTDPDIMIIDEALSVGDSTFANKSFKKIEEFREQGKTIFFVSHSDQQVAKIADKVIWMHYGRMIEYGETEIVLKKYQNWQRNFSKKSKDYRKRYMQNAKNGQAKFNPDEISAEEQGIIYNLSMHEKRKMLWFGSARRNLDQIHFGLFNWAIVGGLMGAFVAVSLYSIQVASQTRSASAVENAKILKHEKFRKQKELEKNKATNEQKKSNKSESSSQSVIESSSQPILESSSIISKNISSNNGVSSEYPVTTPDAPVTTPDAPETSTNNDSSITPNPPDYSSEEEGETGNESNSGDGQNSDPEQSVPNQ